MYTRDVHKRNVCTVSWMDQYDISGSGFLKKHGSESGSLKKYGSGSGFLKEHRSESGSLKIKKDKSTSTCMIFFC